MSKFQIRVKNISKDSSFYQQVNRCVCKHIKALHFNHTHAEGKCEQGYCFCKEFKYGSVEIWDFSENYIRNDDNERKYEGGLF